SSRFFRWLGVRPCSAAIRLAGNHFASSGVSLAGRPHLRPLTIQRTRTQNDHKKRKTMSRFRIPLTAVAAVALLTGAAAAPALAEGTTTTPPPGSSTAPRPNVSAEQLKSFADASLEVDKISQEYAPKL